MDGEITARGRITDDRHIELDEPLHGVAGVVEVVVRTVNPRIDGAARLAFLDALLAAVPTTGESADEVARRIAAGRIDRDDQ
jgi:hypothetical protein